MLPDKCWKGFAHLWDIIMETRTHYLYRCDRCKGTKWQVKRN